MTVLITLPIAGPSTGPFSLYSDVDGYTSPFEIQVPKPLLVAGYTSILVPAGTTIIQVRSLGTCTNSINLPINLLGTSTTTTSTSTTTAPTTTTTTVPTTTSSTTTSTSTTTVPTTTSSTTTTTVPILECVELTNNIVTTQQTCLGTPYDLKLGTITLDLVDSLGAPSIATNDVTVTLSFQTRQCGDSAPVPTIVPVTILTGTSSITHSYTREQTTDCGQGACEVEYDIFQSVVSVEPSLKYAMCNVGSSTTTTSTTSTSTTTVPTTTSTTTVAPTTSTTTTTTTAPPANNYSFFRCSGSGIASVVVSEAALVSAGMAPGAILNSMNTIEITGSGNLDSCYSFDTMTSASLTGVGVVSFNSCMCLEPA